MGTYRSKKSNAEYPTEGKFVDERILRKFGWKSMKIDDTSRTRASARRNLAAHPLSSARVPTPRGGDWVIPGARAIEAF